MHALRRQKLIRLGFVLFVLGVSSGLILYALRQNISLFFTPTEVTHGKAPQAQHIRIGGMVAPNSIRRTSSWDVNFRITDYHEQVSVAYHGVLPDLFRERQGVVASGFLDKQRLFHADEILAKHDENYMPREVKAALAAAENKQKEKHP